MTAVYQVAFFAAVARAGVALGALVAIGSGPILVGVLSWAWLRERPRKAWWLSTILCLCGLVLLTVSGAQQPAVDLVGVLLAFVAACGYAVYTVTAKRLMNSGTPAVEAMASAFSLGGLLLLPVLMFTQPSWLREPSGLAVALWLGLATTTLAYVLFGRGLQVLEAGPAATLVLAEPVVATLLGVLVLGEVLGVVGWIGAALVVVGLALQGLVSIRHGPSAAIIEDVLP
jgi:DME family drug/metabolite transporter